MATKELSRRIKDIVRTQVRRAGYEVTKVRPTSYLTSEGSTTARVAPRPERLEELRARYRRADPAVTVHSYWHDVSIGTHVDEERFRAESMYVWQYLKSSSSVKVQRTEHRYFTYLQYLRQRDDRGLLDRVAEDGAFGAPVFSFPGRPPVSRDLLDSVNEILYLHRRLGILDQPELRVLDIGAGYGRMAHRMYELVPGLTDYACADAIPESTYVCEQYLAFRGALPPCRVLELPDVVHGITPGAFDLAVNIHSFPEMPAAAVQYWVELVAAAQIPHLFIIPNAPTTIESIERDGRRIDMQPAIEAAGYELVDVEPIIDDPAAQALFGVHDHFHLFRWRG